MIQKLIITSASLGLCVLLAYFAGQRSVRLPVNDSVPNQRIAIINEYDPTSSVMLSEHLFAPKYGGAEIAKFLISIGMDVIVLVNQPLTPEQEDRSLNDWGIGGIERGKLLFVTAPHSSPWVRDFAPLISKDPKQGLVDFNYRTDAMLDDGLAYLLGMQWRRTVNHTSVFLDGGNFLKSGQSCYVVASGDPADIRPYQPFKEFGCESIVILPDDFHEHVDMSLKFLSDKVGLVNQLEPAILKFAEHAFAADFDSIKSIAISLDRTAKVVESTHSVIRLPTPLPILNLRRNYANAVIVNQHVLMPRYRSSFRMGEPYPDQKFLDDYEQRSTKAYESAGFKVQTFPADGLIADGGSLHCVLVQLPYSIADLIQ